MMNPDYTIISGHFLFIMGFKYGYDLAKKVVSIFKLSS